MSDATPNRTIRPVAVLPPEVARKIAAGEVIDRPNAIVRELLDNAVDSGATRIIAEISGGGIDKIRIVDNGTGMTKDDLSVCAQPHATSKIASETDLMNLSTLGFRGEALASIAAVSRLEITSRRQSDVSAWHLETDIAAEHVITPAHLDCGTVVVSQALFENFPARRIFLKRPAAESAMCRQTFVEKALPFPQIAFRLIMDGKIRLDLPGNQTQTERFVSALELQEDISLFYELKQADTSSRHDWKFSLIIGEPAVNRSDKKLLSVYVNGRKIQEYALIQAIEYGAQGYFPNGTHPAAALFLEINPALVDFNIHPAKREARFKDLSAIHKAVTQTVRSFFHNYTVSRMLDGGENGTEPEDTGVQPSMYGNMQPDPHSKPGAAAGTYRHEHIPGGNTRYPAHHSAGIASRAETAADASPHRYRFSHDSFTASGSDPQYALAGETADSAYGAAPTAEHAAVATGYNSNSTITAAHLTTAAPGQTGSRYDFVFLGSTLGTFLLAERKGTLYAVDQHAAHERILFDQLMNHAGEKQLLLVPYIIETATEADDGYLESVLPDLAAAGFDLKNCGNGTWEISSVPAKWQGTEEDLARDILEERRTPEELVYNLYATAACRSAVKDGTVIDPDTACTLLEQTFSLPDPHCPHGRPVWTAIAKEELYARVKRT